MSQHESEYGIFKRFNEKAWCVVYIDTNENIQVKSNIGSEAYANGHVVKLQSEGCTVIHVIPAGVLVGSIYKRREKDKNAKELMQLREVIAKQMVNK